MLVLDGLARAYGAARSWRSRRWTVAAGQHSLILGPSGSGKSTLLHLIAGLLRPSRGRVLVAGQDLATLTPAELDAFRGRMIGIVLQRLHLIPALTVRDNLRLARTLARLPPDPPRIDALIADLGLGALAAARPSQLSQGEAQRVAIARAVVNHPALILADEPTSALDDANCETVLALLRAQAEASGATLVIATHDARLKAHLRTSSRAAGPAMSLFGLSLAYIRARALNAALNLALLALGVGMIVLLLLFSAQLEDRLTRDARGIDLVIGSKGSPLQLILSSIYHVDFPTGNIPLAEAERWAHHPLVAEAIPLALGDSLAGFRIVGTEHAYAEHYGAELAAGRLWEAPFEATLGALVAARTGLARGRPLRRQSRPRSRRPGARRASLHRGRRARADARACSTAWC